MGIRRVGVTKPRYVSYTHLKPWLVHAFKNLRGRKTGDTSATSKTDQSTDSILGVQDGGREEDENVVINVPDPPSREETRGETLPSPPEGKFKILSRIRSLILEMTTSAEGRASAERTTQSDTGKANASSTLSQKASKANSSTASTTRKRNDDEAEANASDRSANEGIGAELSAAQPGIGDVSEGSGGSAVVSSVADTPKSQANSDGESTASPPNERGQKQLGLSIPGIRTVPVGRAPHMLTPRGVRLRLPRPQNVPVFAPLGMVGPRIRLPVTQQQMIVSRPSSSIGTTSLPVNTCSPLLTMTKTSPSKGISLPAAQQPKLLDGRSGASESEVESDKHENLTITTTPESERVPSGGETSVASEHTNVGTGTLATPTDAGLRSELSERMIDLSARAEDTGMKGIEAATRAPVSEPVEKSKVVVEATVESLGKVLTSETSTEKEAVTVTSNTDRDHSQQVKSCASTQNLQKQVPSHDIVPVSGEVASPIRAHLSRTRTVSATECSPGLRSPSVAEVSPRTPRSRTASGCDASGSPGVKVTRITSVLTSRTLPSLTGIITGSSRTRSVSESVTSKADSHGTMVELLENITVNMQGTKGKGQRKRAPSESQVASTQSHSIIGMASPVAKSVQPSSSPRAQRLGSPRSSASASVSNQGRSPPRAVPKRQARLSLSDDLIKEMLLEKDESIEGRPRTVSASSGGHSDMEAPNPPKQPNERDPPKDKQIKVSSPALLSALQSPIRFPGITPLSTAGAQVSHTLVPPKSPVRSPRRSAASLSSPTRTVLPNPTGQDPLSQQLARARSKCTGSISKETKIALKNTLLGKKFSRLKNLGSSPKTTPVSTAPVPRRTPTPPSYQEQGTETVVLRPGKDNTISVPLKRLKGFQNVMHLLGTSDPNKNIRINLPPGVQMPRTNAPINFSVISESEARKMGLPVPVSPSKPAVVAPASSPNDSSTVQTAATSCQSDSEPLDLSLNKPMKEKSTSRQQSKSESSDSSHRMKEADGKNKGQAEADLPIDHGHGGEEDAHAESIPQVDGISDDKAKDEDKDEGLTKSKPPLDNQKSDSLGEKKGSAAATDGQDGRETPMEITELTSVAMPTTEQASDGTSRSDVKIQPAEGLPPDQKEGNSGSSEKASSEKASSEKASSEKASSEKASSEKASSEKASTSGERYARYSKFPKFKGRTPEETLHGLYQRVLVVPRPWRQTDGTVNRPTLKLMLESVLILIMSRPGITYTDVTAQYNPILQPVPVLELLEMLEDVGCVRTIHIERSHKCSAFSDRVQFSKGKPDPHLLKAFIPTVDCVLKLGQFEVQLTGGKNIDISTKIDIPP